MRYLDVMLLSAYGHHVETGPDFRSITDVIKWLFVIYFWHKKAHRTYDTYIVRLHHKRLPFPPWNSKVRLFPRTPPVVHNWDDLPGRCVTCQRQLEKKRKRKEKSALKLIKTNQQVKHCIRIKYLLFVNTNTNHVPKSGYNQIDVARIVFIVVCVRVCVLFCYWLSHVIAIAHRWIIG